MKIRWGIIGCGDIVRKRVARAIQTEEHSGLYAACRRDPTELKDFCHRFCVPTAHDDAQSLVADPNVDVVYIATPVHAHCRHTIAAAQQGKHVLVEKPMAMSVAECDEMIDACRQAGVNLGVAYYRPFYPVIKRMHSCMESGDIGDVLSISAVTSTAFEMNSSDEGYWRVIPELGGGGALMDIGSHRIDLFLRLCGTIHDVRTLCSTVVADYKAENCVSLIFRFDRGMHGHLQCYFGTSVDADELSILGTRGRLVCSSLNSGRLELQSGGSKWLEHHAPHENLHAPLVADFVEAIRQQRTPHVSGADGRAVNEVMERGYRDAKRTT